MSRSTTRSPWTTNVSLFRRTTLLVSVAAITLSGTSIGYFYVERTALGPVFYLLANASVLVAVILMGVALALHSARLRQAQEALAEANEKLEALVQSSPLAIVSVDPEGCVQSWSRAAEQILGWAEEEVLSSPLPMIPEDHAAGFGAALADALSGRSRTGIVTRHRRKDGTILDVSAALAPLRDAGGHVSGALLLVADITERSRFLQVAAHELRNPMASVKGILALLRRRTAAPRATPADLVDLLDVAEREVDRLSALLDDVITAFRGQQGRLSLEKAPCDLREVVRGALQPFEAQAQRRFVVVDRAGGNVPVLADHRRLEEVVRNLVGNAVKYSDAGSEIRVALAVQEGDALVAVSDRGRGIPGSDLPRVFEMFFRGSNLAGSDPGGMGLGLYICKDIIAQHGGQIWAESELGRGTTFYVRLPLYHHAAEPLRLGVS